MNALRQRAENAASLNEIEILVEVYDAREVEEAILDLNRINQLFEQGINADGGIIGFYSETTEFLNPSKKAGEPYTLKDTGAFYESFSLFIKKDGSFTIEANEIKPNGVDLFEKFGENILGLTDESRIKLAELITPLFIQKTRELLFK